MPQAICQSCKGSGWITFEHPNQEFDDMHQEKKKCLPCEGTGKREIGFADFVWYKDQMCRVSEFDPGSQRNVMITDEDGHSFWVNLNDVEPLN